MAKQILHEIWTGAVGGLTVLLLSNRLRTSHDAAMKRKQFRSFLQILLFKIECRSEDELALISEFREIPALESQAQDIRHLIQSRLRNRFDGRRAAYGKV